MRLVVLSLCAAAVALLGARSATSTPATAAAGAAPPDIPQSYVFGSGKLAPVRPGATYQASRFPIALRVTPPAGRTPYPRPSRSSSAP